MIVLFCSVCAYRYLQKGSEQDGIEVGQFAAHNNTTVLQARSGTEKVGET